MTHQLIFPMAFYVFFIWLSAIYTFLMRFRSVKSGKVSVKYFRALTGEAPPEHVVVVGRHYDNQFQVPMLFFVTCILGLQLGVVNSFSVIVAWLFVLSRLVHSFILLGKNRVQYRLVAFVVGWVMVLLMWGQILTRVIR